MGLFDKLSRRQADAPLTSQEGVAAVLYLTIAADGEISEEETDSFVATCNRMKLLRDQSLDEFKAMLDKIQRLHGALGFDDALARAAAVVPSTLRGTTFALAADLVFADGTVEENEQDFLDAVQQALQIDDDLALRILEVIQLKNSG